MNKLLKNGFYNAFSGAIRVALALITIPVLVRLMGVEEFGLWSMVLAIILFAASAENSLWVTATAFVARDNSKEDSKELSKTLTSLGIIIVFLSSVAAVTLSSFSEEIAQLFPNLNATQQTTVIQSLRLAGLMIWTKLLVKVLIGVEQAYQKYGLNNILNTIQWVLLSAGWLIIAWIGGETFELVAWEMFVGLVMVLGHLFTVRKLLHSYNLQVIWDGKKINEIIHYSWINWWICLGNLVFTRGDRLIVSYFLGTQIVGIYSAITEATSAMASFAATTIQPIVPMLNEHLVKENNNFHQLQQHIKQAFQLSGATALGLASWLLVLAPIIMQLLLKDSLSESSVVAFKLAVVIYALSALNVLGFYILLAMAINKAMFLQLACGFFALSLITIGTVKFKLLGAIVGNFGFLSSWIMLHQGMKLLRFSNDIWIKPLLFLLPWFSACIFFNFFISNFLFQATFTTFQTVILLSWFFRESRQSRKILKV